MKATGSNMFTTREVYVNEIEFRSREEVYLFGFLHDCGQFHETLYLISRNDLQKLLSQNKAGIEVLWQIENLFLQPHTVPATINLIDLFGTTQVFEAWAIKLDHACTTVGAPNQQSAGLLFVEAVIPYPSSSSQTLSNI